MRGSFWLAIGVAAALWAGLLVLAVGFSAAVLPCYTHLLPSPARPVCTSGAWPSVWMPRVAVAVVGVAVGGMVVTVARTLVRQRSVAEGKTRRLVLARTDPPGDVARAAATAGVERLVFVDAAGPVAVTRGLLRPVVIVSSGLVARLRREELLAVLSHEAEHARRRDPLRSSLARAAAVALWPFPVVRDLARHAELAAEISADRAAVSVVGVAPLARGIGAIIEVLPDVSDAALSSIGGLAERLDHLGAAQPPRLELRRGRLAASVGSLAVVFALGAGLFSAALRVGVVS